MSTPRTNPLLSRPPVVLSANKLKGVEASASTSQKSKLKRPRESEDEEIVITSSSSPALPSSSNQTTTSSEVDSTSSKERNRSDNGDEDIEMEVPETPDETEEAESVEDKVTPKRARKKKRTRVIDDDDEVQAPPPTPPKKKGKGKAKQQKADSQESLDEKTPTKRKSDAPMPQWMKEAQKEIAIERTVWQWAPSGAPVGHYDVPDIMGKGHSKGKASPRTGQLRNPTHPGLCSRRRGKGEGSVGVPSSRSKVQ
jgi:hypothetical protein